MTVMTASPALKPQLIEGPSAWTGAEMRLREADWTYRLSAAEVAEIEAATNAVLAAKDRPLLDLGHLRHMVGFGARALIGRSNSARRPTGVSAPGSAPHDRRTPRGICWGMSTTSAKGSVRPTPICAATPRPRARTTISIVATWWRFCAFGGQNRVGCQRSSVR